MSSLCTLAGLSIQNYLLLDWDRNWLGKVFDIIFTLGFIWLHPQLSYVSVGLTSKVRTLGLVTAVGFSTVIFQALYSLLLEGEAGYSAEEIAYQLTMPGLAEELGFRGVLLTLFNLSLGRPFTVLGAKVGWGLVLQALLFTLPHVTSPSLHFQWWGLFTFPFAIACGWMTERSGSLLPAIITHNAGNTLLRFL